MTAHTLLQHGVAHWAAQQPDAPAVDDYGRLLSYAELARDSGRLASCLQQTGLTVGGRIGIWLDNSLEACVAMLGVLRAGGCYVPMTPSFPAARNALVMVDANLHGVITMAAHLPALAAALRCTDPPLSPWLVVLDAPQAATPPALELVTIQEQVAGIRNAVDLAAADPQPQEPPLTADHLAYVMFTSGTTGQPKGVMLSHGNVMAFLQWAVAQFDYHPGDRHSNHSSITFDLSVLDIFGAWLGGATVCPMSRPEDRAFPSRFIRERGITLWFSVPSVIGTLIKTGQLRPGAFAGSLRLALFCGEPLSPAYAAAWQATQPEVPMHNLYGPTEAAIACTWYAVGADGPVDPHRPVPIGQPCGKTRILILDEADLPVPPSQVGRLLICGPQVAQGYWNRPDLTAQLFRWSVAGGDGSQRMYESGDLAWQDSRGVLHFVGRQDQQIKHLGYRIELGEIEAALSAHPHLAEVVVCHLVGERPELVVVAVLRQGIQPDPELADALLDHAATILPAYMVPNRVVFCAALPKNSNGKIDRRATTAWLRDQRGVG